MQMRLETPLPLMHYRFSTRYTTYQEVQGLFNRDPTQLAHPRFVGLTVYSPLLKSGPIRRSRWGGAKVGISKSRGECPQAAWLMPPDQCRNATRLGSVCSDTARNRACAGPAPAPPRTGAKRDSLSRSPLYSRDGCVCSAVLTRVRTRHPLCTYESS